MARKREYKWDRCKGCNEPFLKKPADKEFCKTKCKDSYHNRKRGRVTTRAALDYLDAHLITIGQAVALGVGTDSQIRGRIRRGRLKAVSLFGRVLINKSDVQTHS